MKKILIVEDDPASRELIREVLQAPELEIFEAEDGGEALRRIPDIKPDLILLDVQLPVLDGYSLLNRIRQDPCLASLKVAALTAFAMDGDRDRALRAGFDAYITKPIHVGRLRNEVAELLKE
jgi:two-component system, cell cycle response regulator DivK